MNMKRNVYALLLSFLFLLMSGACSELLPATARPTETPAPTATQPLLVEATLTQTTTDRPPGPACFPSVVRQSLEPVAYSAYPDAILALARELKISAICACCNDFSALSAAYTAEKLGLPGHDDYRTSQIIHHKDEYRKFASANGIPTPRALSFTNNH